MSLFQRREEVPQEPMDPTSANPTPAQDAGEGIEGDRGIPFINRARSLQSRVSNLLAIGLMAVLGIGLLGWYYSRVLSQPQRERTAAQSDAQHKAQGDMPLPDLGDIDPTAAQAGLLNTVLGARPEEPPPDDIPDAWLQPAEDPPPAPAPARPSGKTPEELLLERQLAGPSFADRNPVSSGSSAAVLNAALETSGSSGSSMEGLLRPSVTPAVRAKILPTQRLLLPKGSFLDCTLETAIDSTLPGMTTCITATDTFSVDRTVVLLERGTKLVGETRGEVRQGSSRVFVLWTEARTPKGIVVPLASPGTDELGRSGLPGTVNRHFFERFGAAILVSVIDGAIRSEVQSRSDGGTIIYDPRTSQDITTEVLKSTVNIPPTVVKHNGDRIQILVARDLDFRSVYELRCAAETCGRSSP